MRVLKVFLAVICLCPLASDGAPLSLSAESGQFKAKTLGPPEAKAILTANIQLTEFRGTNAWPSGAYLGFQEGEDRKNSIQFVLVRNSVGDSRLAAGYRILKDGREQSVQFIEWLPLNVSATVKLTMDNGLITLQVENGEPIEIKTSFREVAPFASVSSATANFNLLP